MHESKIEELVIGKALKSDQLSDEKYSVLWGIPILSSDAISSVAYACEEILIVLVPVAGLLAYKYMLYASLCIVGLLFTLVFSYRQTIDCYPNGGGSYIVAGDNLGPIPGLVAGGALSVDYILTVAVSTCAGVAAITSAFPSLLPFKVIIALFIIFLMTIGNLRGVKDASKMFGIPTYLFIVGIISMILYGIIKVHFFNYTPYSEFPLPTFSKDITIFIFLKAFSSGCTALTGVEAVSNGIPNFKEPSQKNAKKVLLILGILIFFIFGGMAYLATMYHAVPNDNKTAVAQIATQVFGKGSIMFYYLQVTTAFILIMAANTSYADFPLLLSLVAKDSYAPRQFAKRGKRLSFSNGIILLWLISSILVLIFQADQHKLLPLYAVGVFISFTLSQTGMFTRWVRLKNKGWRHKAIINGIGAIVSFVTIWLLTITKLEKSPEVLVIFLIIILYVIVAIKIKKHYNIVASQLKLEVNDKPKDITAIKSKQYVIVPIDTLNRSFLKALNYARTISDNVIVFHVSVDSEATARLEKKWKEYNVGIELVIKQAPYRNIIEPIAKYIESDEYAAGPKDTITIVMSNFVVTKWWQNVLHNQTTFFIKSELMKNRNIAVITIPYIIDNK